MSRPTFLNIDLFALRHNLQRLKTYAFNRKVIAMVKANAYGHGLVRIAKALTEADAFGVASLEEGIKLREAGITHPIILMEGLFYADEVEEAAQHQFSLVVHHEPHIEMLEKSNMDFAFPTWLKINTGMHRLGIDPSQVKSFYQRLNDLKHVAKPIGLMTHFAQADERENDATNQQIAAFKKAITGLKGPISMANSAAIIGWPQAHADWIRPGLILYGASPFKDQCGQDHHLLPVMTLHSRLIAINQVRNGGKVGYGGTWEAEENMLIGIVGVGYGDGYPQFAQNGTPVVVNKTICPLVGRVSMDMLAVDLSHAQDAKVGDPVVLWGEGLPVETIAKFSNTSPYEILTRMTPRPKIEIRE